MSTCTNWANTLAIDCKNAGSQMEWGCVNWAANTIEQCAQWADEGSNQCSHQYWNDCHWYSPWNCIAGLICDAWYWVASWVCIAFAIVTIWTCLVFGFIWVKFVCSIVWLLMMAPCLITTWVWCKFLGIGQWLGGLFGNDPGPARIDHVFVLMLENRSFDHALGFSGITGVDEKGNATPFNDGFDVMASNYDPTTHMDVTLSTPADYSLSLAVDPNTQKPKKDVDPGHEFLDTVLQQCGEGATYDPSVGYPPINHSGFVRSYAAQGAYWPGRIMRCFAPRQLPVLNQLAREFVVCDRWFSSMPGPTWPNRLFAMAATSGGLDNSPDAVNSVLLVTGNGFTFENGNIFDALDDQCLPWQIYAGDDFPVSGLLQGMNINRLRGRISGIDDLVADVADSDFDKNFVFIEPKYGYHAFDIKGPGDFTCGNSMHPLDDVTSGERLVKTVYEAIRNSPHWERSLLIVIFDEHGGFYDHVAPGRAVPPGDLVTDDYSQYGFKFDQLGVRVPAIVVSAHTPRGVIDHTVYDHTSILATVERLYGMDPLTQRDKAANDLRHLMNLEQARTDAPTTLNPPATPDWPISCEDDEHSADKLMAQRAELHAAQTTGVYRERKASEFIIPRVQYGFLAVACRRALETGKYPERARWLEDFAGIRNGVDAALFLTEVLLKIRHGVNLKKTEPPSTGPVTRGQRILRWLDVR